MLYAVPVQIAQTSLPLPERVSLSLRAPVVSHLHGRASTSSDVIELYGEPSERDINLQLLLLLTLAAHNEATTAREHNKANISHSFPNHSLVCALYECCWPVCVCTNAKCSWLFSFFVQRVQHRICHKSFIRPCVFTLLQKLYHRLNSQLVCVHLINPD